MSLRRRKRDSAENLYRHCVATGAECPPDVVNKYTQNTLADRLSKIFASILYLGGLAIGTGKGGGGSFGYRPIGEPVGPPRVASGGTVVRPNIVVDPVGPAELIPLDTLNPDDSVIPLLRGTPETSGENVFDTPEILGESDPVSDVTINTGQTVTAGDENPAILEVSPTQPEDSIPPPAKRPRVSRQRFQNPAYDPTIFASTPNSGVANVSDTSVTVDFGYPAPEIGEFEEIELEEFNAPASPRTSTPADDSYGLVSRITRFYNRRIRQIQVQSPTFLTRPQSYVAFGYDNPAFNADVSTEFLNDLQNIDTVTAAPHPDFQDIVRMNRMVFQEGPEGRIRVSRIANRGTIRTRTNLLIGERVHYFNDLSSIHEGDGLELVPLTAYSGDSVIVTGQGETAFVDPSGSGVEYTGVEDIDLVDDYSENFERSQLVFGTRRSANITPIELFTGPVRPFVDALDLGINFGPPDNTIPSLQPTDNLTPLGPADDPDITLAIFGTDFYLHPGLLRRKRKRKNFSV
ncbi:L2 capsid protein [Bos taurus papillomavirus 21]|uniref:Minor capsid protein L2 n=1 Tax=Bos taurus papillomavirus 21 TaxID=1887219 RepID=A0A1B2K2D0_9PAPI|nr:L2 capsid protein [Bos taurus papillomavirus 21]ANZ90268.1 L2 capsid protein [Bos taurus papillomavirus 21]